MSERQLSVVVASVNGMPYLRACLGEPPVDDVLPEAVAVLVAHELERRCTVGGVVARDVDVRVGLERPHVARVAAQELGEIDER